MSKSDKNLYNTITTVAVYATAVVVFFLVIYYVIVLGKGRYHSDCLDSLLWAEAVIDGKGLVNSSFMYAGIIPFGGHLVMIPFVAAFGVSVKAQVLGMAVFTVIFIAALFFMLNEMGFSQKWSILITSLVMFLLLSSDKLREIYFEHIIYYSTGLLYLFLCTMFTFKTLRDKKISSMILLGIVTIFAAACGMQIVSLSIVPIMAAVFLYILFDTKASFFDLKRPEKFYAFLIIAMGTVIGLIVFKLVCHGVKSGYADGYSSFSDSSEWISNFFSYFTSVFTLLGAEPTNDPELFSLSGIFIIIRAFVGLIIIIVPIIMCFFYKRLDESSKLMLLVHHGLSIVILLGFTFGELNAANWRLSPVLVTGMILVLLFIKWVCAQKKPSARILAIIIIPICLMYLMIFADVVTMKKENDNVKKYKAVAEVLEAHDLDYGYGTFWNAGIITLLSDSKVKVRNIKIVDSEIRTYYYQTNLNWYDYYTDDRFFYLLSESEFCECQDSFTETPTEIIDTNGYKIVVFN